MSIVTCDHCDGYVDSDEDCDCFIVNPYDKNDITTLCEWCREEAYDDQQGPRMVNIRIAILWLQWKLLRRKSVVLIDFDGEMNPRLVHGFGRWKYAKRMAFGIARVTLDDDGRTRGACYVTKWEPLFG